MGGGKLSGGYFFTITKRGGEMVCGGASMKPPI